MSVVLRMDTFAASPSLRSSTAALLPPPPPSLSASPLGNGKRRQAVDQPSLLSAEHDVATKPKQSKSRNGCVTCKAKRLKCDETKPACQQCHRRHVDCGGYKKDFKWRSFEEATFTNKAGGSRRRQSVGVSTGVKQDVERATASVPEKLLPPNPSPSAGSPPLTSLYSLASSPSSDSSPVFQAAFSHPHTVPSHTRTAGGWNYEFAQEPPYLPNLASTHKTPSIGIYSQASNLPATTVGFPGPMAQQYPAAPTTYRLPNISQSADGGALHQILERRTTSPPNEDEHRVADNLYTRAISGDIKDGTAQVSNDCNDEEEEEEEEEEEGGEAKEEEEEEEEGIEEMGRKASTDEELWLMRQPMNGLPVSGMHPVDISGFRLTAIAFNQPRLQLGSYEMLMRSFDTQTCGILSIKNGPSENPWRSVIMPLAKDSPALFHAVSSMAAFHSSTLRPEMKVHGVEHMRESIQYFAKDISNMHPETALATTLVLAFAEAWDVHVSTGIKHLRGAKALVNSALMNSPQGILPPALRFLCKTWVYMDVIARLTSLETDESDDLVDALWSQLDRFETDVEVDPLMGVAHTLFPLIGRVATLIRKVRGSSSNSIQIVSQASELKIKLESWFPPLVTKAPEDLSCGVQSAIQTAEAYRWTTLLYLHQAVPELPSQTSAQLAHRVLEYLATVPTSSRTMIVQIYPLLAGGCEAASDEDRGWVRSRWAAMAQRLQIGPIDRCLEITEEVWDRRDAATAEVAKRCRSQQQQKPADVVARLDQGSSAVEQGQPLKLALPIDGKTIKVGSKSTTPGSRTKKRAADAVPASHVKRTRNSLLDISAVVAADRRCHGYDTKRVPTEGGESYGGPEADEMKAAPGSLSEQQNLPFSEWSTGGHGDKGYWSPPAMMQSDCQAGRAPLSGTKISPALRGGVSVFLADREVEIKRPRAFGAIKATIRVADSSVERSEPPLLKREGSQPEIREILDFEQTVRGKHHWVGVMKDWNWEVLLG